MKLAIVLFAVLLAAAHAADVKTTNVAVGSKTAPITTVNVAASKNGKKGAADVAVTAPAGTKVVVKNGAGGASTTSVKTVGTDVVVKKTPKGTATTVNTPVVKVVNTPQGTVVSNIPFVGTIVAPANGNGNGHRKMLRAL